MRSVRQMDEKPKNKHAVALGTRGGKAGKGSPKRREAAIKANRARWASKAVLALPADIPADGVQAQ